MKLHTLQDKVSLRRYLTLLHRQRGFPFLLMFTAFLLTWLLWPVMVISIDAEDGTAFVIPIEDAQEFSIIYTHSVEQTDVEDVFAVTKEGDMVLTRTEYESFGAGLPTESFGEFEKVGNRYINRGLDEVFDSFILRVGRTANHRIKDSKGEVIPLTDHFAPGESVRIEIKKVSRFETWHN